MENFDTCAIEVTYVATEQLFYFADEVARGGATANVFWSWQLWDARFDLELCVTNLTQLPAPLNIHTFGILYTGQWMDARLVAITTFNALRGFFIAHIIALPMESR